MLERFHVQFEWRFGLKRSLVAVVFLGLFVGLNLRKIEFSTTSLAGYGNAWGWPFPFIAYTDADDDWIRTYPAHYGKVPWTHTTYRMLQLDHFRPLKTQSGLVICAIVDILFALTVLLGVLFLRIPRRKTVRKWLRGRFAWRFSLARLVVAMVFLGVVVGLNVCGPVASYLDRVAAYRGWPLPVSQKSGPCDSKMETLSPQQAAAWTWVPWTHQSYRLLRFESSHWLYKGFYRWESGNSLFAVFPIMGFIDALVGIVPLLLLLFLHPRRKPPDEAPA